MLAAGRGFTGINILAMKILTTGSNPVACSTWSAIHSAQVHIKGLR